MMVSQDAIDNTNKQKNNTHNANYIHSCGDNNNDDNNDSTRNIDNDDPTSSNVIT